MSTIESSKTLAAIGALLLFLSFVPVIGIVGIILLLIGMKGLSEQFNDESIYRNALRGVIFGIIGIIASSVVSALGFFGGFAFGIFDFGFFIIQIVMLIVSLVIAFIFYLLMAMNFRRAFNTLAEKTGENNFRTAGTLLWWGAILTIVFVGLILVWIAWILAAIAFFSMKTAPPAQQPSGYAPPPPPPMTAAQSAQRFCPNCGAQVQPGATFCPNCGKPLPSA